MTRITEILLADDPAPWLGIDLVADRYGVAGVGTVALRFGVLTPEARPPTADPSSPPSSKSSGIVGWALLDAPHPSQRAIDGLMVTHATDGPEPVGAEGAFLRIDHVVVTTPDLGRTVSALEAGFGEPCKRIRTLPTGSGALLHQAFFRLGEVIVEVVGPPEADREHAGEPARFGGLVLVARDLDDLCRRLGPDVVNAPKAAVQEGRRIATVRAAAGLGCPVALMDDRPPR
jgi:hypothetical protein